MGTVIAITISIISQTIMASYFVINMAELFTNQKYSIKETNSIISFLNTINNNLFTNFKSDVSDFKCFYINILNNFTFKILFKS